MSDEIEKIKADLVLQPLNSPEELQNWIYTFFDIKFPMGVVYPGSTHSPVDAMWRIYHLMKTGESRDIPQICMLASRDSYKTLSAAAIEVLCMLHFEISVAHGAAIKSQSEKAIQYVNSFFRKVSPYLEKNGWKKLSDSKAKIEWLTDKGDAIYLRIVVATVAGMNCVSPLTSITKADMSTAYAKDIKPGDLLTTFNYWENEHKEVKVGDIGYTEKFARKIYFEEGHSIVVSDDHQMFTNKGWVLSEKIRPGFKCIGDTRQKVFGISDDNLYENYTPQVNLRQMVLGTLVGDASINVLPSGSCRYQVYHCDKQKEYIDLIARTFEQYGIKTNVCKDKNGHKLTTQTHPYFKAVNNLIKNNGIKTLSNRWLKKLDIQGLAFVLMDDGDCHRSEISKNKEYNINFSLMGYSEPELDIFIDRLKDFNLDLFKVPHGEYTNLRLTKDSSRTLSRYCKPYVITSLQYKLICSNTANKFVRYIDTGKPSFEQTHNNGFTWENIEKSNLKIGRDFKKRIKDQLNLTVSKVEPLGLQKLIDIHIDTDNEHEKSFYANQILVHNSEHVPMLFMDEIDVVQDPRALEEAKMIPSVYNGYFPLTIYLSTRKYAGGLMEKTLKDTDRSGGEILRWNIVDVTERIPKEQAKVHLPKVKRYISRELPLRNLSVEEFEELNEESRHKYEMIEAYEGIADHPMLSVMKNSLVDRPQGDYGGLYKPIYAVHNNFRQTSPEMGEAQLLCNKPSSSGLVYPRFEHDENSLTIDEAYHYFSGEEEEGRTLDQLIQYMHNLGIEFYAAADWGNTDETSLGVFAKIANGKTWLIDLVSAPDMEIPEIVQKVKNLTELYKVKKWFCDSNYPAYIKMLKKTNTSEGRIMAVGVKKGVESVIDGITCVQSKIVDANNNRHFKVLQTGNTERVFDAFDTYRWKLDGKGDPIDGKPEHGKDGTSDIMDMIRYYFYSMFGRGSKVLFSFGQGGSKSDPRNLQGKIDELTGGKGDKSRKSGKNKGIILDM